MSGRAVAVLTALVVVLAGLVWWSFRSGDGDRPGRLLGDLERREVAAVDLVWQGEAVALERRGDGAWTLTTGDGVPRRADRLTVERFLGSLSSWGSGRRLDEADPAQTGLDRPRGRIELRGGGGVLLAALDVGAPVPGAGTVVVRVEPSGEVRAVPAGVVQEVAERMIGDGDGDGDGGGEGWRAAPPAETPPAADASMAEEEPSRSWTARAPSEVDRIVLDSALFVGDEPLDLIRGPRDWVVVDDPGRSVPFPDVSDLLRAVTTARAEAVEPAATGEAGAAPVLYLTLADAPGARRETLTLFAERSAGAEVVPAASTARPGEVLLLPAETARAVERVVREVAGAVVGPAAEVSDPGTKRPASGRPQP